MNIRMTSNLFAGSRMHGVIIPRIGEPFEIDEAGAEALMKPVNGYAHAEPVEDEPEGEPAETEKPEPVKHDPITTADMGTPETATEKRKPGRPRKADTE